MWDELCWNQSSSFSHFEQPELRGGRRGEEREEREKEERERRKRKREHPANADMTEALKSLIRQ